jgi:CheY-like chemotaxis protein
MDGRELCAEIRRLELPTRGANKIPLVVLSANSAESDELSLREVGMDFYLSKRNFELETRLTLSAIRIPALVHCLHELSRYQKKIGTPLD